jgi:predicted nucleic acid-binding Zn ribbon protein
MSSALPEPQVPAAAVRTPVDGPVLGSRPCTVCLKTPLQGGETACSAGCRRKRSRQRDLERQQIRDAELVALLDFAEKLEERAAELRAQVRKRLAERAE